MKFHRTFWGPGVAILLLSLTFVPGCSEQKDGEERGGFKTEAQTDPNATCSVGSIAIIDMYVSPTDRMGTGGAYCRLKNSGEEADSLVAVTAAVAQMSEIHEMVDDGGMMTMRQLKGGFPIPAKGLAELKPGGAHIMLINVDRQLNNGDTVEVELRFARAGSVKCRAVVGSQGPKKGGATEAAGGSR